MLPNLYVFYILVEELRLLAEIREFQYTEIAKTTKIKFQQTMN
jgi:hypothetical protein